MVVRVKCERMEFYCYTPSGTFVVLTADQFVGCNVACFDNRGRIATFVEKFAHFL